MFEKPKPFQHPCATEEHLRACAHLRALNKSEVIALMQGFLPRAVPIEVATMGARLAVSQGVLDVSPG